MKEPLAGERSRDLRGLSSSRSCCGPLSDPGPLPPATWGLESSLVSLPGSSCSRHSFGFSSPAICPLSRMVLKLNYFFSGYSHMPAFNPFRLKLCVGKSWRKIDDGQTDAVMKTLQRLHTSRGLQLSHPYRIHGSTNPSCSPCLSRPSPPHNLPLLQAQKGKRDGGLIWE